MRKIATPHGVQPKITYNALVGQVVLQRRKVLGIGQEAIATALGLSQPSYSRLEQGQTAMTLTQLRAIAIQLRTTSAQITNDTDQWAERLKRQGVEVTDEKDLTQAAILIGLGILAALLAAGK